MKPSASTPQIAQAYFNRGIAYDGLGEFQQAIEDLNEVLRRDPKDAEAYYRRRQSVIAEVKQRR